MIDHAQVARQNDIDFRESLRIIFRVAGYFRYFKARMAAKIGFITFENLIRLLILPWPMKIIIDHAILGEQIDAEASGFPSYLAPAVLLLRGMSATEIMLWMLALGVFTVAFMGMTLNRTAGGTEGGAFSSAATGAVRTASAELASGHDMATQTEQAVNLSTTGMGGLLGILEFKINLRLSQSIGHVLRTQLANRILSLPMSKLDDQRIGDSTYRVMYDSTSAVWIFHEVTLSIYSSLLLLGMAIGIMLTSYGSAPLVIVVGLSVAPLTFLLSIPAAPLVRRVSAASRTSGSATTSNIEEGMSNILAIQSLGTNEQESRRFSNASAESFKRYRFLALARALMGIGGLLAFLIGQISFFVLMSGHVIEGTYTAGDYFVVLYYYFVISAVSFSFGFLYGDMQSHVAGMARVFHLLDTPAETSTDGTELADIKHGLVMEDVGLTYPDGRVALQNINLNVGIGDIIALVGPTGAGKTTLAYLVPALLQATAGKVSIDGVDLKTVSVDSLRRQVSYVFQETQLFSDSILENIRYGNKAANLEDVKAVARTAGAHDFIMELPQGYDTNLGTVTSKLSVGQKQRISIARGLLRDSKILILDEPTSALDPETEAYLVDALHEAAKNKLVIVIAHRLSTITHADRIYFIEGGEIRESGHHDELMALPDGHYRRFVSLQAGTA
ncbi:MAG: ABC transporter ATP-binding protein [Pseudomonadota bacterium]